MTHVLRKGVGPFSAGTRVNILGDNIHDNTFTVTVLMDENKTVGLEDLVFDIDKDYVVKRRDMTDTVPVENSRSRRRARKAAQRFVDKLLNGTK